MELIDQVLRPPLGPGQCRVGWVQLTRVTAHMDVWHRLLDRGERARCDRFIRANDQVRFIVGHALARLLLSAQSGMPPKKMRFVVRCQRCGGDHGKPRLAPAVGRPDLDFNISHSADRVVVALTTGAVVGVDVERTKDVKDMERLVRLALSAEELCDYRKLSLEDRALGFFTLWARKEALLKATGHGLAIPLRSVTLRHDGGQPRLERWPATETLARPIHLFDLNPGPGYTASVAVLGGPTPTVQEVDASPLFRWGGGRLDLSLDPWIR